MKMSKTNNKKEVKVSDADKTKKSDAKSLQSDVESIQNSNKKIRMKKFGDLEGKFLLVRVGTQDEPATKAQIDEIQTKVVDLFEKNGVNCLTFVTHHAVNMSIIEKNGA
jgi:hypothetical protein